MRRWASKQSKLNSFFSSVCFFPFGFEYFSVFPNIVTKLIPIQSDLLIYVYFHSIALTSRKQRRNNDFPLTFASIPIKEVLPQLLKKQLFVFFVLLIVLSTVLEESYMIKDARLAFSIPSVVMTKIVFPGRSSSRAYLCTLAMWWTAPPIASSRAVQPPTWYCRYSVVKIVKELKTRGLPSPTGKETWCKHTIEVMLTNIKYTGNSAVLQTTTSGYEKKKRVPSKSILIAEDDHDPIISKEEYSKVQEERKRRSNIVRDENGSHRSNRKYSAKGLAQK